MRGFKVLSECNTIILNISYYIKHIQYAKKKWYMIQHILLWHRFKNHAQVNGMLLSLSLQCNFYSGLSEANVKSEAG